MTDERTSGDCTCGAPIPDRRRDGFCSSWCAARDAQGLPPQAPPPLVPQRPTALVPAEGAPEGAPEPPAEDEPRRPPYRQRRRLIASEVEDRLKAAGMLDTWQAAQVLDLADALDWQGGALSARAQAHRELERQMSNLLRGQAEAGSRVGAARDEFTRRREERQQRAGGA